MDRKKMMLAIGIGKDSSVPQFDIPEGMDISTFEDGDEKEIVAKVRRDGDSFSLLEVNGISLAKASDIEEEEDEEEYEDEAADAAMSAMEEDNIASAARSVGLV